MARFTTLAAVVLLMLVAIGSAQAQLEPATIQRGKQATALVEVTLDTVGVSGSAFCVDKSGLFVTNAHVVDQAGEKEGALSLVLEIGTESRRSLAAQVLRHDDRLDLALLQVKADPRLVPLELGHDADLKELAQVFTFGYPFGRATAVGRAEYPDITVLPSRITSLRRDSGELLTIQFDNQINPGNSGGPVLDDAGRVVGVAVATVRGAALNLAIPVGRLVGFLEAPGLAFKPPEFTYADRARPVTWTIPLRPPTPQGKIPEGVSVVVRLSNGGGPPQSYPARLVRDGVFEARVIPAPHDPDWRVDLTVMTGQGGQQLGVLVPDEDVRGGGTRYMLSVLRKLRGGRPIRVMINQKTNPDGPALRLGRATTKGAKPVAIDLNAAEQIDAWARTPPRAQTVDVDVEARKGAKVLATVRRRTRLEVPPGVEPGLKENIVVVIVTRPPVPPVHHRAPVDEGLLTLGGELDVDGMPRGAARAIQPPQAAMPSARLTPGPALGSAKETPLVRRLDSTICDVVVGGGGRFLIVTFKDAPKIAIFDVNAADVVKTINLPSKNVVAAAGAQTLLLAFPDEKVVQLWDLAKLERKGGTRPSPIDGRIKALALGSDSDGPALAVWSNEATKSGTPETQLSFIDLDSLTVLKAALMAARGSRCSISTTGGSFRIADAATDLGDQAHLRASAGGALYGLWEPFRTLAVRGKALLVVNEHAYCGHVAPGPDGHTVFTGLSGRLDPDGQPVGAFGSPRTTAPVAAIASSDPAYYLTVSGLPDAVTGFTNPSFPNRHSPAGVVTASVHATGDGARLLTVHGLDEMAFQIKDEDWQKVKLEAYHSDFTLDKRFHLVPAAHLLVTIPLTNDRLVLRRLDLDEALDRAGGNYLVVTSTPTLAARAGQTLEHRVTARSKKGGLTYALAQGPDGLAVAPDGRVTWAVPERLRGEDVTAMVRVRDASGQERAQELMIRID